MRPQHRVLLVGPWRAGAAGALAQAVRATSPWALVVDGRVVSRSVELTPADAVALVAVPS